MATIHVHAVVRDREADARLLMTPMVSGLVEHAAKKLRLTMANDVSEVAWVTLELNGREIHEEPSEANAAMAFRRIPQNEAKSAFVSVGSESGRVMADIQTVLFPNDERLTSSASSSFDLTVSAKPELQPWLQGFAVETIRVFARTIDLALGRVSYGSGQTAWERGNRLTRPSFYALSDEYILAPDWAVVLGTGHVERLGGLEYLESTGYPVEQVRISDHHPLWLGQATATDGGWSDALPPQKWIDFLAPVLTPRT